MSSKLKLVLSFIIILQSNIVLTAQSSNSDTIRVEGYSPLTLKSTIAPAALITYGAVGKGLKPLKWVDTQINDWVVESNHSPIAIDGYTRFAPIVAVYALNLFGVEGRHRFLDRSAILLASAITATITTKGIKWVVDIERPDGSGFDSFPSGHTTIAFVAAEFMWQEYRHRSAWYGVAAYTVAAGTGALRIYNNDHWLTDVMAGAGIGILSTKFTYWAYPKVKAKLFPKSEVNAITTFTYMDNTLCMVVGMRF